MGSAMWILQGGPLPRAGCGTCADVTRVRSRGPNADEEQRTFARVHTDAYRCAPFIRVVRCAGGRTVLVGQARVWWRPGERLRVELALQTAWSESPGDGWANVAVDAVGAEVLRAALRSPRHCLPAGGDALADRQRAVAVVAKAVAEGSRNAVAELRGLRYELEERLAAVLRPKDHARDATVLADLVELSIAVNRARDQVREAAREGLWTWLGDGEAYQRHRAAQDPTLLNGARPATAETRPWMSTHDAAVRQCLTAERLLGEEAAVLARLLAGASTLVVSRDAEAQQRFNAVVTLGGLGLALPALVLAVYGADGFGPNGPRETALAFLPVVLAALGVAWYAGRRLSDDDTAASRLRRHPVPALLATLALLALLGLAAVFFPEAPPP